MCVCVCVERERESARAGEDSGKCVCGACVGRLAAMCALSKIEDIYSDTP